MSASASREKGRYASSYDDEALVCAVGDVLAATGVRVGSQVSQRRFDGRREEGGHPNLPSARQIATRLQLTWSAVVDLGWRSRGELVARAVTAVTREPENHLLDERHVVLALRRAAALLGQTTLTPGDYDRAVEKLIEQARRDGTVEFWRGLLPTQGQIIRLFGDWDAALAAAGLEVRRGRTLTDAGRLLAAAVQNGASGTGKVPRKERTTRRQLKGQRRTEAEPEPAEAEEDTPLLEPAQPEAAPQAGPPLDAAPVPEPDLLRQRRPATLTTGRAIAGRQRTALAFPEAVAAFAAQQAAWPASITALRQWGRHYGSGSAAEFAAARARARELLTTRGQAVPPDSEIRTARRVDRDLPPPAGPAAGRTNWDEEACVAAVARFLTQLPSGAKPTVARYIQWRQDQESAPWPRSFAKHGGWNALLDRAKARLRAA